MKLNRERIVALLALLVLAMGFKEVALGILSPTRGIEVEETTIPRSAREVLPRKYRTFAEEGEPSRNPFSFSEGWQRLDAIPMEAPSMPPLPRLLPLLSFSPSPLDAGFPSAAGLPAEIKDKEEGGGEK